MKLLVEKDLQTGNLSLFGDQIEAFVKCVHKLIQLVNHFVCEIDHICFNLTDSSNNLREFKNVSAKLFKFLGLPLNLWNLRNVSTNLIKQPNLSATLFTLLNLLTAMASLMLPDVNRSNLCATAEMTETFTGVTFEGLWR